MKKDIIQTAKVIILSLVLTMGISYVFAWTGPTATPPNNNTATPINVGATGQTKTGALVIEDYLSVLGNGYFQVLGVNDATPDGGLTLDVNGKIGATEYCDQNGANCTAAGDLGGNLSYSYNASGGTNGYVIFPNGFTIQWMNKINITGFSGDIALPIEYEHRQFAVVMSEWNQRSSNHQEQPGAYISTTKPKTHVFVNCTVGCANSTRIVDIISIGY